MRHANLKLLAVSACALLLVGAAWTSAWAEDLGSKQEAKQDDGFLDGMAEDAGNFFSDVGDFFADDVPEFFTEDVPAAFTGDDESQVSGSDDDPFAAPPKPLTDKAGIKETQALLNAKGYKAGTADGIVGRNTRSAIRAYQKDNQLRVTGAVTDHLLLHLQGVRPPAPSVAEAPKPEKKEPKSSFIRDQ
ncbi:MAG: peptidoglycan-binding domain-containing protein [Kiloniellales bacterium]|nr:peptidoglycan-binding domain-containing protein [Kiloniellales bacterium]